MTTKRTSTELASTELATWLDAILAGDSSLEPPQDSEALAVVWAMRPDLAPPAKLSIESVLSRVSVGPFMEKVGSSERMEGEDESASHEKVDTEALDTVEDDFVTALFSEARKDKSASPSVSLDDVFARIESGPFGTSVAGGTEKREQVERSPLEETEKPDGATSSSLLSETEGSSANNNRWWNARWLAGGLAAALVLLTLVPSEFEAPVSEDSIFAPREDVEMEEALPADEIHYSRRPTEPGVSKFEEQAKRTVENPVSPKKTLAPSKKSPLDSIAQQPPTQGFERETDKSERSDLLVVPSDSVDRPTTKSMTGSTREPVIESKPSAPAVQSGVVGGATASDFDQGLSSGTLQLGRLTEGKVLEDASSVGTTSTMMSQDTTRPPTNPTNPAPSFAEPEMDVVEDVVEEEPMPLSENDVEENEEVLEEQTLAVPQVEEVVATDRMEALTVSKESKRRQFGKAKGQRAKKAPMAAAESAPMAMSADDAVSGYAYTSDRDEPVQPLPTVLTVAQRQQVNSQTTVQQVLDLCDPNKPTEALDILWVAHPSRSQAEQIQLLEQSSVYSNGDSRYLKRNWLKLAQLYRKNGNVSQAEQYEQRALSLP